MASFSLSWIIPARRVGRGTSKPTSSRDSQRDQRSSSPDCPKSLAEGRIEDRGFFFFVDRIPFRASESAEGKFKVCFQEGSYVTRLIDNATQHMVV